MTNLEESVERLEVRAASMEKTIVALRECLIALADSHVKLTDLAISSAAVSKAAMDHVLRARQTP